MAAYSYPPTRELRDVENAKIEALNSTDPLEQFVPTKSSNSWLLHWTIEGYVGGLQQLRGLNVAAQHVERVGPSDFYTEPGVWGDAMSLEERELTLRAMRSYPGGGELRIDVGDLIMGMQDTMLERQVRLQRYLRTTLITVGTVSVADKKGAGGYRYVENFTPVTYNATTWATVATATPLADLRAVKLLARGKKANFGAGAIIVMNQTTANNLLSNTNAADLGGQRPAYSPIVGINQIDQIFLAADLPRIVVWDEGYYDLAGNFNLYFPNGAATVISGRVPGTGPIGEYRTVFQAVTNDASPYRFIKDSSKDPSGPSAPPTITLEQGHNGGPVILRPWMFVNLDVS